MNAFAVHVHSIFHLCRAAAPHMAKQGEGAIILLGSAAGLRGCHGALAYGVAGRNKNARSTKQGVVVEFYGLPPIEQKTLDGWGTRSFTPSWVGNTGGELKGAFPQFARGLARELADQNIRVNCVSPGIIRTPFQAHLTPEQIDNNIRNRVPLHREGRPEEVAHVIVSLIESDFITGENVVVDGGMTMRIA